MEANNNAMLREVVKELLDAMYDMGIDEETVSIAAESPNCHMHSAELLSVIKKAKAALAKPPRNCYVGTPEEQEERFDSFCVSHYTSSGENGVLQDGCDCPCYVRGKGCNGFAWGQLPCEEGEVAK